MAFQLFLATDLTGTNTGIELWVTDGTALGTKLLLDIDPGPANSTPGDFAFNGPKVYFTANDGSHGTELWVTDGTTAGTIRLDAAPAANPASYSNPTIVASVGAKELFIATDNMGANTGTELWVTDGTAAGTIVLKDINPGAGNSTPANFTFNINAGKVFFTANDGSHGTEVWVTDGTTAGTLRIDAAPAANPASYTNPTIVSAVTLVGKELFTATDNTVANTGTELWVTDGTAAGTLELKDINPGAAGSTPANFTFNIVTGKVFFTANDGSHGTEVWVTDGTTAGTLRLDAAPAANPASYTNPTKPTAVLFAGKEIFTATDNTGANTGTELWVTDGTAAGTALLQDINPGAASSTPANLTFNNTSGKVFFTANDGSHGTEVWVTDGTTAGTIRLDAAAAANPASYTNPTIVSTVGAKEFFIATDNTGANTGTELWVTDGTAAGTALLKDIDPGAAGSTPGNFSFNPVGGGTKIFFTAGDGSHGTEVWVTDGTTAGTLRMDAAPAANPASYTNPTNLTAVGPAGKEIFIATDNTGANTGTELWVTDGTAAGTTLLKDINPGAAGSNPANFSSVGGKVFFTANDGSHGTQEWVTDGTAAGTLRLDSAPAANPASYGGPLEEATSPMLSFASDSAAKGDNITNVAAPVLSGGSGGPGDIITLYDGSTAIGTDQIVANGTWSVKPTTPLADGVHALTAVERGGGVIVAVSAALSLTIDTTAAAPAGLTLDPASDTGTKGDNATSITTPVIDGTGEAGAALTLFDGATTVGTTTVGGGGNWSVMTSTLAVGGHTLTAQETDVAGNVSPVSSPLSLTIEVCFCRGTRILTERGEVPVEELAVGDQVKTLSGEIKPIVWIGVGRDLVTPANKLARPVIVRRGALAENVPHRDLYLTHGHSLYLDGVLIPVEHLVNHRSILLDEAARVVEYYHIELEDHDVLFAEGAPAESYYDDENRARFYNTRPGSAAGAAKATFAPVLRDGDIVESAWARLHARAAGQLEADVTNEPDLHLVVDGERIDPDVLGGGVYRFAVARPPSERLLLRSRRGVPSLLGQGRSDHRPLGVAITQMVLHHAGIPTYFDYDGPQLREGGCYPHEDGFCWTDGEVALPARFFTILDGACTLEVHIAPHSETRYPIRPLVAQAA